MAGPGCTDDHGDDQGGPTGGAGPAAWLVSKSLLPRPLNAPFQSVATSFAVHVLVVLLTVVWRGAAIVLSLGLVAAVASLMARFRRAAGSSASSSAGWPWRPGCRWRCWR
jgi:hypothetical protein